MGELHSTSPRRTGLLRVCVTGAECTGKTELALALGRHYSAPVVPDVTRDHFMEKVSHGDPTVHTSDVLRIVERQAELIDRASRWTGPLIVCDTDVLTTAIWCEAFLPDRCADLHAIDAARRAEGKGVDLYVLCAPDIPFVPDELRSTAERRAEMHERYRARLASAGVPIVEVSGELAHRLRTAIGAIDALIAQRAGVPGEQPAPR